MPRERRLPRHARFSGRSRPSRNPHTMRKLLLVVLIAALGGCETVSTTQPGAVGIERKQTMLVSSQEVNQAAVGEYQKVLAQARQKGVLDRDAALVQRVRNITARLV